MKLADKIKDYCIQRRIKKGKEKKVYRMLWVANYIFRHTDTPSQIEKADRLASRACKLIRSYGIHSDRVNEKYAHTLTLYSET